MMICRICQMMHTTYQAALKMIHICKCTFKRRLLICVQVNHNIFILISQFCEDKSLLD